MGGTAVWTRCAGWWSFRLAGYLARTRSIATCGAACGASTRFRPLSIACTVRVFVDVEVRTVPGWQRGILHTLRARSATS